MPWRDTLTRPPGVRNAVQDPRFLQKYLHAPTLTRGQIQNIRHDRSSTGVTEGIHRFHFLTNPWEISTSYTTDLGMDITNPNNFAGEMMNVAPPMREGLISVSFSLLLDRTYEVWSGTLPEGVLHDMAQLERVLGVPDILGGSVVNRGRTADAARAARGQAASGVWRDSVSPARNQLPGIIIKRPVRFLFGGKHAYTFDGYVTSLSITMMKFNVDMTPTRAGINISAQTWGDPADAPVPNGNSPSMTPASLGGPLSGDQGVYSGVPPTTRSSARSGGGGSVVA